MPLAYLGVIDSDLIAGMKPGWYYLKHLGQVVYKSYYTDNEAFYVVVLNYQDINLSGRFEPDLDTFKSLKLARVSDS